jgi:hypothetical protein
MQKETDTGFAATASQLFRQWDEVIVVDPDDVVWRDQRHQRLREAGVHLEIDLALFFVRLGEIEPVVQSRPQATIGVAEIVALRFFVCEVDRSDGQPGYMLDVRRYREGIIARVAAPAKPESLGGLERVAKGNGEPASLELGIEVRDPVGNNDKAAIVFRCLRHQVQSSYLPTRGTIENENLAESLID